MRAKYQRETVGNQQSAIQRLTQERFQSYDTPDTYETRIRPLLLGVADNDAQVLGFFKSQLTGDLYMMMRIANPGGIDAFFTELKTMWLDRAPNLNGGQNSQGNSSAEIDKLNSKIASLETQLAELIQVHSRLAQRLHLPENVIHSNNALSFDKHINEELEKRLGVIETHLAELLRKDTIDSKSAQYQYSESSDHSNGGLEKRLGQVEALLAKLARGPKSKSGRVHMATADEQSDPIFSDDDTSKSEDNDYNSDNSSAGSDSRNRDMNIYISHGNGKKK